MYDSSRDCRNHHHSAMETTIPKTYTYRDVGVDCDWKTSAETEDEIIATISKQSAEAHPTIELTSELVETVRQAVKEG